MNSQWIDPARFRRILLRSIVMPLMVMGGLAVGLVYQINYLVHVNQEIARTDLVAAQVDVLRGLLVDKETALRGYLLTGSTTFLEPYRLAELRFGSDVAELEQVLLDDPAQLARLEQFTAISLEWDRYARTMIALKAGGGDYASYRLNLQGRALMDRARSLRSAIVDAAEAKRLAQVERARHVSQWVVGGGVGLTLLLGGVLALFGRRQLLDVSRSYERAIALTQKHAEALARSERALRAMNESLERRVRERTAQLEEANRELESFAYSVSHDLRSPLRHITGFADLLRKSADPALTETSSRYLDTISEAAKRASTLVDELLAFSRMARTELRNTRVDMRLLVTEIQREIAHEAEGRQVVWEIGELPSVYGDGAMLRLAVRNLLSNALKYTRPREVARIAIDCVQSGDELVFRVRDNGVGFDMAFASQLFGVFKRLHRDDEFEGTGIGLANVRRIIQRHGGRTWAEGEVGEGATFCFSLPRLPPPKEDAP